MPSFGENLRRERELRGVDLREMAEATKISIRFLQALEDERVEILPGGIFPRAFVRQYAKYLGLDADRLVAEFVYTHGGEPAPLRGAHHEVRVDQGPPRALVLAGVVLAVLGLIGWRVWASGRKTVREPAPTAATAAPSTFAEDRVFPPPSTTLSGAGAAGAPAAPARSGALAVALTAQRASWVEVKVDGTTALNRVLSARETQRFDARHEVVLSVGNAGGVAVTVNDRPLPPLGREGDVRRGVAIRADTLAALLAGQEVPVSPAPAPLRPSPRPRPPSPSPSPSPATLPVRPMETTRPLAPVAPASTPVSPAPEA